MVGKRNKSGTTVIDETSKKITAMLRALENEDSLSQWEQDFVARVTDRFLDGGTLTQKQYDTLERIYRKTN